MNTRITASGAATIAFKPRRTRISVNAALTGTITVTEDVPATPTRAAATDTIAVLTNPGVGTVLELTQSQGTLKVNPSTTCDITVSTE